MLSFNDSEKIFFPLAITPKEVSRLFLIRTSYFLAPAKTCHCFHLSPYFTSASRNGKSVPSSRKLCPRCSERYLQAASSGEDPHPAPPQQCLAFRGHFPRCGKELTHPIPQPPQRGGCVSTPISPFFAQPGKACTFLSLQETRLSLRFKHLSPRQSSLSPSNPPNPAPQARHSTSPPALHEPGVSPTRPADPGAPRVPIHICESCAPELPLVPRTPRVSTIPRATRCPERCLPTQWRQLSPITSCSS